MTSVDGQACFGVYAQSRLAGDADHIAHAIYRVISELLAATQQPATR